MGNNRHRDRNDNRTSSATMDEFNTILGDVQDVWETLRATDHIISPLHLALVQSVYHEIDRLIGAATRAQAQVHEERHNHTARINELTKTCDDVVEELAVKDDSLRHVQQRLQVLEGQQAAIDSRAKTAEETCARVTTDNEKLYTQVETLREAQVDFGIVKQQYETCRQTAMREELDRHTADLAASRTECSLVKAERDSLRKQVEDKNELATELAVAQFQRDVAEAAHNKIQNLAHTSGDLVVAKALNKDLRDKMDAYVVKLADAEAKLVIAVNERHAMAGKLAAATAERDGSREQAALAERSLTEVRDVLDTKYDTLKSQFGESRAASTAESDRLKSELDQARSALSTERDRLQSQLDDANSKLSRAEAGLDLAKQTSSIITSLESLKVDVKQPSKVEQLTQKIAAMRQQHYDECAELEQRLDEEQTSNERQRQHVAELEAEIAVLEPQVYRLAELEETNKELESKVRELKKGAHTGVLTLTGAMKATASSSSKRRRLDRDKEKENQMHRVWKDSISSVHDDLMSINPDPAVEMPDGTVSQILRARASLENNEAAWRHLKSLQSGATPEVWFCFEAAVMDKNDTWSTAGAVPEVCSLHGHECCFQVQRRANGNLAFRTVPSRQ